jgi:hypothetical protein
MKKGIVSPHILARVAIVDPLLTVSAPPGITASSGMDALTHAIETYVSRSAQPLTLPLALQAVRLIGKYLRRAVANGSDLEARRNMANASMLAGRLANGFLGVMPSPWRWAGGLTCTGWPTPMLPTSEFNDAAIEVRQHRRGAGRIAEDCPSERRPTGRPSPSTSS